jgi:hypothetical protein
MKNRLVQRLERLAVVAALLLFPGILPALSVLPTDFNNLVDDADSIFQGEVLSVRSDWTGLGENRHIATFVQFRVTRVFKGDAPNPQTLEIFGGTVDAQSMKVPGLPEFQVGKMELLFVRNNGKEFCPLVGVFHGRFRVAKDATSGEERVFLHDGRALTDTAQIGKSDEAPATAAARTGPGMTVTEFGQRIQARLAETSAANTSH